MIKIGLTGGIGSGKSTVSKIFSLLGIPIYNSDLEARELMNTDVSVKNKIINLFGERILLKNGIIDRKIISNIVFKEKNKLQKLNEIIHPAIANHFNEWLLLQTKAPYILKESAILFESGANKQVDKVIVVTAPKELRIKRILNRDTSNKEEILQRMKHQMEDDELIKLANYSIINDEKELLINQVLAIHKNVIV